MKITPEIKTKINELYLELGSYSAVAREIGCAASTIKRHIIPNYVPIEPNKDNWIIFKEEDFPIYFDDSDLVSRYNLGEFCELDSEEKEEIEILWTEMNL